jgi:hypothetical protein
MAVNSKSSITATPFGEMAVKVTVSTFDLPAAPLGFAPLNEIVPISHSTTSRSRSGKRGLALVLDVGS